MVRVINTATRRENKKRFLTLLFGSFVGFFLFLFITEAYPFNAQNVFILKNCLKTL